MSDRLVRFPGTSWQEIEALPGPLRRVADTHATLEIASLRPPDGHVHPGTLTPGWSEARPGSYRPFPPSPAALENIFFTAPQTFPLPSHTGLPHTCA